MTPKAAQNAALRLIDFLETGEVPPGLFADDVFCDFTLPCWRLQAQGLELVVALRRRGHPGPSRVPRWRCDPTPTGFLLEVEERWEQEGENWYCRELIRADVVGESIAEIAVYCTGDWNAARQAEHQRAVHLLRP
ncbi:MAG: hypothetical protein RKO66_10575 [Candidatus Contendobacter sp.]|nr:hypothetical protein [Candidatus Contendobacter sp.]MDS4059712.1 hypothetical protein [Candidatus Contendobacter sp.]